MCLVASRGERGDSSGFFVLNRLGVIIKRTSAAAKRGVSRGNLDLSAASEGRPNFKGVA